MASTTSKDIINEKILVEWIDRDTLASYALGSCSYFNTQATDFFLRVVIEPETGNIYIYISLIIDVLVGSGARRKEIRLIFLPHTFDSALNLPLPFESLQIPNLSASSILQQADLTNSGHIIRVKFNLASQGCAVRPQSKNPIKPTTSTSRDLLEKLKSLSAALSFNVYIRHSDYAKEGLKKLNQRLRNPMGPSSVNLVGLFEKGRNAMFLNWGELEPDNQDWEFKRKRSREEKRQKSRSRKRRSQEQSPPPIYAKGPLISTIMAQTPQEPPVIEKQQLLLVAEGPSISSSVQISQSPPNTKTKPAPVCVEETVVAETPPQFLNYENPVSPTASQTSIINIQAELETIENGLGNNIGPDDEYNAGLQSREASLDREAAAFFMAGSKNIQDDIGSDEESYLRELSLAGEVASTSERLLSEITAWLTGAMTINEHVYMHARLNNRLINLTRYAVDSDTKAHNATMVWCSTILFCDPLGSGRTELWNPANLWLISDMAQLIKWSNTYSRFPEMRLPNIRAKFMNLGDAARDVAELACEKSLTEHRHQKAQCVSVVLQEFCKPAISGREKRS